MTSEKFQAVPVTRQIAEELEAKIRSGSIQVGEKLPSTRDLAAKYNVAMPTVTRAMQALEERGFVQSIHGRGWFCVASEPDVEGADERVASLEKAAADGAARIAHLEEEIAVVRATLKKLEGAVAALRREHGAA